MPKSLKRFVFNLKAKNRHGTHSPFIYEFLDKALYKSPDRNHPDIRLKQAAQSYFESREFLLMSWEASIEELDIWLNNPVPEREKIVVYLQGIRSNPENFEAWSRIRSHRNVGQILETFGAALLFFRSNQVREHFKIRL